MNTAELPAELRKLLRGATLEQRRIVLDTVIETFADALLTCVCPDDHTPSYALTDAFREGVEKNVLPGLLAAKLVAMRERDKQEAENN